VLCRRGCICPKLALRATVVNNNSNHERAGIGREEVLQHQHHAVGVHVHSVPADLGVAVREAGLDDFEVVAHVLDVLLV
jgi:hypothetical protein